MSFILYSCYNKKESRVYMKKIISIILVILWMTLIFIMSSSNSIESNNQSGYIVNYIANLFNITNLNTLSYIVRKLAHLTEYFILGFLVINMITCYKKKTYISIIICILYAISDELHQSLVPGRSPQIKDIIIDSIGSLSGILTYLCILNTINKYKRKKEIKKQ